MSRSSFFKKTMILTLSNILTGTLSFIFSILLSREIGSKGIGLYQLVMPVYSMFLFITGGGITIGISKIAAEKKALSKLNELYRTVRAVFIFEILWSSFITLIVILFSGYISQNVLDDKRTLLSLIALCPALIIISLSSIYKGVYYGIQNVKIPAFIDILEKIIRISIMYPLVMLSKNAGIEYSSAAAALSLSCGELSSFLLFFVCYRNYKHKHPSKCKSENSLQLVYNVLKLAVPLALNGILSTVFTMIATIMIPKRLQTCGFTYENSLSLLGKLQGMTLNIIFFPVIIIGALNVILIPSISEAVTFNKNAIVNHRINTAFRIASVVSFSSMAIMLSIPKELGILFFKDPSIGGILKVLTPGVPIVYMLIVSHAVLNGLGKQNQLLINSTIASILDILLLYIFMGIPKLNIYGFSVNFIASAVLGVSLNLKVIFNSFPCKISIYNIIILPFLCFAFIFVLLSIMIRYIHSTPLIIILAYTAYLAIYLPLYKVYSKKN